MNKKTIYICYGKDGLLGHLVGDGVAEIRKKVKAYNQIKSDKIIRFKDPMRKKMYEVTR